MAVNRSELRTRLTQLVGSVFEEAQMNEAINSAIDAAWPQVFQVKQDVSATLDDETFSYQPTASDITEKGIAQVYVQDSDEADHLLRRVKQRPVSGTWTLYFPADTVEKYDGDTLRCFYAARYARLGDDTTTTEVPAGYIVYYAAAHLAIVAQTDEDHFNVDGYQRAAPQWFELAERMKRQWRGVALPQYVGYMRE